MSHWNLQLTDDPLRNKYPVFPSFEARIAEYETYYLSPAGGSPQAAAPRHADASPQTTAPDPADASPQTAAHSPADASPQTAAPAPADTFRQTCPSPTSASTDIRRMPSPFSTLLCLYGADGNEYTFSSQGMRHVKRSLPWQGHYHTHDYIEILYVVKGSFRQVLLGECQTFSAGEFAITDRNLEHADVLAGTSDTIVLFLSLQSNYLDQLLSSYDHQNQLQRFFFHALRRQRKEQSYLHLHPAHLESVFGASLYGLESTPVFSGHFSRILESLIEEDYFPREGSPEIIRGNLIRLLSLLCRHYSMKLHSSDRESKEKAFLYELERYIRLHFSTVSASELENVFHYHRNYYNLLLQKYLGVSFQNYLQNIRMEHAASLLQHTSLPIREIALAAGYHNSSHFYHLFEKQFGLTPSAFRKVHTQ